MLDSSSVFPYTGVNKNGKQGVVQYKGSCRINKIRFLVSLLIWCSASGQADKLAFSKPKINFEYAPSYYRYEETIFKTDENQNEVFMTLTSVPVLHSFTCDIKRYFDYDWYNEIRTSLILGNVNYNSTSTGSASGEDNLIFTFENTINHCFKNYLCGTFGYGFRYLDNDSQLTITSTGNFGYERENYLHFLPIGLSFERNIDFKKFSRALFQTKFYLLLDGRQVSHFSRFGCDADMNNKQNSGFGVESTARLYANDRRWYYGAMFQYWKIDASDTVAVPCFGSSSYGSEPDNTTTMISVLMGYHYQ